jgi:hypothetical protein
LDIRYRAIISIAISIIIMSTRELSSGGSDAISPAPSMSSGSPHYHRLSKVEQDEDDHFDTNSSVATSSTTRSGMPLMASAVHPTLVADHADASDRKHRHHDDDDEDEDHIIDVNETDSLVDELMLRPGSSRGGIFRGVISGGSHRAIVPGSWTPSSLGSGGGPGGIVEVPGEGGMAVNGGGGSSRVNSQASSPLHHLHSPLSTKDDIEDGLDADGTASSNNSHKNKNMTFGLSASHSSSVEWEDYDDDDDDFDDDDADAVVRRYHHVVAVSKVPSLPAEFSHQRSFPKRIWQSFLELRAAARQRRAARLLTLPSESAWSYDVLQAWFMTWCCDATDRGIALVAILLFLWLVVGMTVGNMSSTYWWMGILLFTLRISARRSYEMCIRKVHHHGRTHRLSADSMEMSTASMRSSTNKANSEPKAYRDQSEPGNII